MAHPFGLPEFNSYIEWLKREHGGTAQTQIRTDRFGRPTVITILSLPNGNTVKVTLVSAEPYHS